MLENEAARLEEPSPFPRGIPKLELREICGLYEVFAFLSDQVTAFVNQPRFEGGATSILDDLAVEMDRKMQAMCALIKATKPVDKFDRDMRAKILIRDAMLDTDNISELAAIVAALAVPERGGIQ